jgi:hypothetical protein
LNSIPSGHNANAANPRDGEISDSSRIG